jgi:hypothetical protein
VCACVRGELCLVPDAHGAVSSSRGGEGGCSRSWPTEARWEGDTAPRVLLPSPRDTQSRREALSNADPLGTLIGNGAGEDFCQGLHEGWEAGGGTIPWPAAGR